MQVIFRQLPTTSLSHRRGYQGPPHRTGGAPPASCAPRAPPAPTPGPSLRKSRTLPTSSRRPIGPPHRSWRWHLAHGQVAGPSPARALRSS